MLHLLVLQKGEKELTHSFYTPIDQQPTFQDILSIRRKHYEGWVLQEWLVR